MKIKINNLPNLILGITFFIITFALTVIAMPSMLDYFKIIENGDAFGIIIVGVLFGLYNSLPLAFIVDSIDFRNLNQRGKVE